MFSSFFAHRGNSNSNNTPNVGESSGSTNSDSSTNGAKEADINPHFICPITGDIMIDPVVDREGENPFNTVICDTCTRKILNEGSIHLYTC